MPQPLITPEVEITDEFLPTLKNHTEGDTVDAVFTVKIKSIRRDLWVEGEPLKGTIEIIKIRANRKSVQDALKNEGSQIEK